MIDLWHFIVQNLPEVGSQTVEHLYLTFFALMIAALLGLPVGILASRYKKLSGSILGSVGVIQTIPSIALLGFLLPLFGIGTTPAIIALFLYALLPIVRNTYSGITDVDDAVVEAARGMGMSGAQILRRIELPLAMPVIFAGIRTATVINVGVATLCALIGAGGLGEFIFRGIALNNVNMILAGAIPAALMALGFDFLLGLVENNINRLGKPVLIGLIGITTLIGGWLLGSSFQSDPFRAGMPTEFIQRADGYRALETQYQLDMPTLEMNQALMYQALKNKKVDVIGGYSTDGRIKAYDLTMLTDDQNFFPPYSCAPVIRRETLERYPELESVLNQLSGKVTNKAMIEMNFQVDEKEQNPNQVAKAFLQEHDFRTDNDRTGEPELIIGGKNFTEQFILGHMFAILIENYTSLTVDTKLGLAGTKIVFDALQNNEIDLYPEYTGTGLYVWLKEQKAVADSLNNNQQKIYHYVKERSKKRFDITWLNPLGFENTYALMMRREQAQKLSIGSISELSEYVQQHE